ncbi:MAG: hypothetical protein K8R64_03015 [Methanosarcinaceae archaeon]|nr:hypothetical protein [Methanosarcinaceae archaeon]
MSLKRSIIVCVLLLTLFGIGIPVASATDVILKPSSPTVCAGDAFTVEVFVYPNAEISGMYFEPRFDDSKMHIEDVSEGTLFQQWEERSFFTVGLTETGSIKNVYGCILGEGDVTTPAVFATITLVAGPKTNGISHIYLEDVIISDPKGHAIDVTVTQASVKIYKPSIWERMSRLLK